MMSEPDCLTCHVLPVLFQWLRLDCELAALHTTSGVCFFHVSPLGMEIEHLGTGSFCAQQFSHHELFLLLSPKWPLEWNVLFTV